MAIQEDITLRLRIDKSDIAGNLDSINTQINDLKNAQKELNQAFKDGKISATEYATASAKLKTDMGGLTQQANLAAKAVQAEKGSIDELSAALNLNRKAYNALSQEQRDNSEIGGKLRKTINDQQSALGDLNKSVGKPGLRGGLTEAFSGMAKSLGVAALAFVSVESAGKLAMAVINSGSSSADKFEQVTAGLGKSLASMARSLRDLDFEGFFTRAFSAYDRGVEAAKKLQDYDDLKSETELKRIKIASEINKLEADNAKQSKLTTEGLAKREENNKKIREKNIELGKIEVELAEEKLKADKESITATSGKVADFDKAVAYYKATLAFSNDQKKILNDLTDKEKERLDLLEKRDKLVEQTFPAMAPEESRSDWESQWDASMKSIGSKLEQVYAEKDKLIGQYLQSVQAYGDKERKLADDNIDIYVRGKLAFDEFTTTEQDLLRESVLNLENANLKKEAINVQFDEKNLKLKERAEKLDEKIEAAREKATEQSIKRQEALQKAAEQGSEEGKKWSEQEIKRIDEELKKKKELNDEYNQYLIDSDVNTKDILNQTNDEQFSQEMERIDLEYSYKLEQLQKDRDLMILKLYDDEDFFAKKKKIEQAYNKEAEALGKKRTKDQKMLALDRASYEVSVAAGMASSISTITDQLGEENRAARYAALVLESGAAIADVFVNYKIAQAKGFAQMGPILGIPAATAMEIASGLSIAAIIAKTATGLAAINSAGKAAIREKNGDGAPRNNQKFGGVFAVGGPIIGGDHASGGVNINAEGGEFVVNKRAMAVPQIASMVVSANAIGNGQNVGGFLTEERVAEIASAVVGAVPVYVLETDITGTQRKAKVRESKFVI